MSQTSTCPITYLHQNKCSLVPGSRGGYQNSSTASHAECRFCQTLILANGIFAGCDLKANVKRKYRIAQKWQIELQNGK
jgi:hypothetical protein